MEYQTILDIQNLYIDTLFKSELSILIRLIWRDCIHW